MLKRALKRIMVLVSAICIQACAVTYTGSPASLDGYSGEICIIESPNVRAEFLASYETLLKEKDFPVKIIDENADLKDCEVTSTYLGKWSWDFEPYLAYAEIHLYRNGAEVGEATYSAPRGGFAMTTKIYDSTESKIRLMLEKIFPGT